MTEFKKYIQRYLDLVNSDNLTSELDLAESLILSIYAHLTDDTALFKYASDKWTLKEILQHLIDCERIFQYRALAFSRGENQDLPGFDEEFYAKNSDANKRNLSDLSAEFSIVRTSSKLLFQSFSKEKLKNSGTANHNKISVKTLGKLIVGHNLHHLNIIKERYHQ